MYIKGIIYTYFLTKIGFWPCNWRMIARPEIIDSHKINKSKMWLIVRRPISHIQALLVHKNTLASIMANQLLVGFGLHLKKLRLERNLSQEQLGMIAELDRTYISGIERGVRNVSLTNIFRIAQALNVPASELFHSDTE